jgi:hypothetical protein
MNCHATMPTSSILVVLMMRHDGRDGNLFPAITADWALNKDDATNKQFSRMDDLQEYIGANGKYHFR